MSKFLKCLTGVLLLHKIFPDQKPFKAMLFQVTDIIYVVDAAFSNFGKTTSNLFSHSNRML